jgi:heme d1 biosynthesis radical SAM protein NirJ
VVIWNVLRRCNLNCLHCYAASADRDFADELTTPEAMAVLHDLAQMNVPAVIFSGGEPLLRPDLFDLARQSRALGLYTALSSNGLLMADPDMADRIRQIGFDYVGVSLDGLSAHHDRMRDRVGAFEQSLQGIRQLQQRGVQVGLRFTVTRENRGDLDGLIAMMQQERLNRLYLSHLNYSGRGYAHRSQDATHAMTRQLITTLCTRAWYDPDLPEIVTGNNDADGPFFLRWILQHHPELAHLAHSQLTAWGGNGSGVGVANIDNRGNVHPDIFWWQHTLGNVRDRPFSAIWSRNDDPLLNGLRQRPRPVEGRCASCQYLSICGGNTRVRAWQTTGNPWAEDPGCYLSDEEIAP